MMEWNEYAARIPRDPGVYLWKQGHTVLYVGKAKNLKNRVRSYFSTPTPKASLLLAKADRIEWIITHTEVESLILENRLIKDHTPRYNIRLKDAKGYGYIRISADPSPRLERAHRRGKSGTYYGPYTDGLKRRELIKLTQQLFLLRTCKTLPKKTCLLHHIGLCSAPCIGAVTKEAYAMQVAAAHEFLNGKTDSVKKALQHEMQTASAAQEYEHALACKHKLDALAHLDDKQYVETDATRDQHIIAHRADSKSVVVIMRLRKGVLSSKDTYTFDPDQELLAQFIPLYYSTREIPSEIIVNEAFWEDDAAKDALESYLAGKRGRSCALTYPLRGEKRRLMELAEKNIPRRDVALEALRDALNLASTPRIIECFDISNLGAEHIVAGMTRHIDGLPDTNGYRKFRISVAGPDDYASMYEAVHRRYKRLRDEGAEYPDLILIDGGLGQYHAAAKALAYLSLTIPLIALAKENEELYTPELLVLPKTKPAMLLLRSIRDRTHDYVLGYNRKRRSMKMRDDFGKEKRRDS